MWGSQTLLTVSVPSGVAGSSSPGGLSCFSSWACSARSAFWLWRHSALSSSYSSGESTSLGSWLFRCSLNLAEIEDSALIEILRFKYHNINFSKFSEFLAKPNVTESITVIVNLAHKNNGTFGPVFYKFSRTTSVFVCGLTCRSGCCRAEWGLWGPCPGHL